MTCKMVVMIGLPGSGKSTYARENYPEYTIISSDAILERIAKDLGKTYDDVFDKHIGMANHEFFNQLDSAIANGDDIVIDRTNLSKKSRARVLGPLVKLGKVADYHVTAVLVDPGLEVVRERLRNRKDKKITPGVIYSMRHQFDAPDGTTELIDEVIEVEQT